MQGQNDLPIEVLYMCPLIECKQVHVLLQLNVLIPSSFLIAHTHSLTHSSLSFFLSHFPSPFPLPLFSLPHTSAFADGSTRVEYDHIFKVILIGDNGVGKSSFIRRYSPTHTHTHTHASCSRAHSCTS